MQILLMIIYVLLSAGGLSCFKLGSSQGLDVVVNSAFFSIHISWLTVFGLVCYVLSFVVYMGLIVRHDLSYIAPILTGAVYLVTIVSAVLVLKETVSPQQIVASVLILLGVLLMNAKH